MTDFPALVEDLTAEWLGAALGGRVDSFTATQVGTGQIGTCYRLALEGDGVPERLVAKLGARDRATRELLGGVYRTEARFYDQIAPTVDVRVPGCHYAGVADNGYDAVLLLDDVADSHQGDQVGGGTVAEVLDGVVNLAGLHRPRWCDPTLLDVEGLHVNGPEDAATLAELYGPTVELFLTQVGELLPDADHETLRATVPGIEAWSLARAECFGLVHGDYRLDNLLFPDDGGPGVVAVDWQTLSLGLPARDLAYFVETSLDPALRREHERDLVGAYHEALGPVRDHYPLQQCWDDYVLALTQGVLLTVFGCAYGTRTERGDAMFATMVSRSCEALRDHDG